MRASGRDKAAAVAMALVFFADSARGFADPGVDGARGIGRSTHGSGTGGTLATRTGPMLREAESMGRAESTDSNPDPGADTKIQPPGWALVVTPLAGWLSNTSTFTVKVPKKGSDNYTERELTLGDDGWGAGLLAVGFYRWLSMMNVFFVYPDVADTRIIGNVTQLTATLPTGPWIRPTLGAGLAYLGTSSTLAPFDYASEDRLSDGTRTIGHAHFDEFRVDTSSWMVFPEVGVKLKITIQSWYIRPYYQYLYENICARARTPGGTVNVFRQQDGRPEYEIPVAFDKGNTKTYHSHVVGLGFSFDLYYFLRLHGSVYFNATHQLLSTRMVGTLLLNQYVGLSTYFERQDMIIVDNVYVMFGLCFLKMPSRFFERLNRLRNKS